ncbi:MAG: heavy-metal-associated domain-containing protein [Armatimonadota bacterium]
MSRRMVEMEVSGMSCRRCAEVVSSALKQVPGVVKTTVDLDSGWALLTINDYVREEDLVRALEEAGYSARVAEMAR